MPPAFTPDRARLLFIDDEPTIRRTLQRLLSRSYDVTTCANAHEALGLLERGARFDVILCDHSMPDVTGPELYDVLVAAWPAQSRRFAFLAGTPVDRSSLAATRPFLEKPVNATVLREYVDELLARWGPLVRLD